MSDDGIPARVAAEIGHWFRSTWTLADVAAHWDATEDYDDINAETYSYFRRFVDGLRLSRIPPKSRILDLCARTGNGTLYFHQHGLVGSAVCADPSERMGEICLRRLHDARVEAVEWLVLRETRLPFAEGSFDTVLCFETVEHIADPEALVSELGRVIRPGGVMILTTPNVLWEPVHAFAAVTGLHHSEGPHRFIRVGRLRRMIAAAGFNVEVEETTVLVPAGPKWLVRAGEWVEERTRRTVMPLVGLRRIFVCRKRG